MQITLIVWQKLSAAREVLVEQQAGDVMLAGKAGQAEWAWQVKRAWLALG